MTPQSNWQQEFLIPAPMSQDSDWPKRASINHIVAAHKNFKKSIARKEWRTWDGFSQDSSPQMETAFFVIFFWRGMSTFDWPCKQAKL